MLAAATGIGVLASAGQQAGVAQSAQPPEPKARPDLVRQPYSPADVDFMRG